MKTIEIDGVKYNLTPVEEQDGTKPVDKYKKIREVVKKKYNNLVIKGEEKQLYSCGNGEIIYTRNKEDSNLDELYFEETTLDKLEVNDLFVLEEDLENFEYRNVEIVTKVDEIIYSNYLYEDVLCDAKCSISEKKIIKILRD